MRIGILAFHGDVSEHVSATVRAAKAAGVRVEIVPVRTKASLEGLDGLIIPGGESPTLRKLCERENMWDAMKKIPNIFGTCAGAILLSWLGVMDIAVDRNAYGRQVDSFEKNVKTKLGPVHAMFIRAPKIKKIRKDVKVLAKDGANIIACEQKKSGRYYLACCFHPELTTSKFHEHFLRAVSTLSSGNPKMVS